MLWECLFRNLFPRNSAEHLDAQVAALHGARLISVVLDDAPLPPRLGRFGGIDLRPELPWWQRFCGKQRKRLGGIVLAIVLLLWLAGGSQQCLPLFFWGWRWSSWAQFDSAEVAPPCPREGSASRIVVHSTEEAGHFLDSRRRPQDV